MKREIEANIERTYEAIKSKIPSDVEIDSLEVVKQVIEYQQFWKPEETNVVLLAESHVYTDEKDYEIECNRVVLRRIIQNYPVRFVRFVYCLGYGENKLLTRRRTDRKNTGTPQYWKIFSSCVADDEEHLGFGRILKTGTPSLLLRLRNKVNVLRKMKRKGVWLVDASIVGLYGSGKKNRRVNKRIIEICWRDHIADVVLEAGPKHIIVIGKGVGDIIRYKLLRLDIPFTIVPQPQARGTSEWQLENYKNYQRICSRYS